MPTPWPKWTSQDCQYLWHPIQANDISYEVKICERTYFIKFYRILTLKDGRDSEVIKVNSFMVKPNPREGVFQRPHRWVKAGWDLEPKSPVCHSHLSSPQVSMLVVVLLLRILLRCEPILKMNAKLLIYSKNIIPNEPNLWTLYSHL